MSNPRTPSASFSLHISFKRPGPGAINKITENWALHKNLPIREPKIGHGLIGRQIRT